MSDIITLSLSVVIILLMAACIAFWCEKRYEVAVFLVALSPWLSSIFLSNTLPGEQEAGIGSYIRISLLTLIGAVGIIKFIRTSYPARFPAHFVLLGAFLLMATISSIYSIDQKYTLIRSFSFISLFGFLLGLHSWLKDRIQLYSLINTLFIAISFCVIINILSIFFFPEKAWLWDGKYRLQCLWGHPNSMGAFCMISYPILMWKYSHSDSAKRWVVVALIIAFIVLHLLTGSRTSIAASFFGICIWLFVLKEKVKLLLFASTGIIIVFVFFLLQFNPIIFEREEMKGITDLTGRTEIWGSSLTLAKERPILGYGYSVGGKVFEDPRFYHAEYKFWSGSARSSLHNGYLSIAVGVGLVGLVLFIFPLFMPFWHSIFSCEDEYKAFVLTTMSMCLLTNFFESSITGGSNITSSVFWTTWVIAGKIRTIIPETSDTE